MDYILPIAMLAIGLAVGGVCAWLVMRTKTTALNERLQVQEEAYQEKLVLLEDAEKRLSETFQAMSSEALKNNNQSFLELAKENFGKHHETAKGDLEKRQQKFEALVNPVKESLKKVDDKLQQLETARAGAYQGLLAQVKVLRINTERHDIRHPNRGEVSPRFLPASQKKQNPDFTLRSETALWGVFGVQAAAIGC